MDDIDKAFYKLTVKERDLARHQLRGAELEIEALKLRVALLGELVEDFDAWATHGDWCDGYSGRPACECGLAPLRERARASATSVASPIEDPTEPAPVLEVPILDTRPRCGVPMTTPEGTVHCDREKGHGENHEAYYGWTGRGAVWG